MQFNSDGELECFLKLKHGPRWIYLGDILYVEVDWAGLEVHVYITASGGVRAREDFSNHDDAERFAREVVRRSQEFRTRCRSYDRLLTAYNTLYYAPGGPGYKETLKEFRELQDERTRLPPLSEK